MYKRQASTSSASTASAAQDNYLGIPYGEIIKKWWQMYNDGQDVYKRQVENGHKVARSITSEEEYKQLRGSNEQKANLRLALSLIHI